MLERRKTARLTLDQVTVECYTYQTQTIPTCEGRILNLGMDGMKLEIDEPADIQMDDEMLLTFILPDGSRFTKKRARVVWQARGSETVFGVYFPAQPSDDVAHLQSYLSLQGPSKS
jgi:hypothetical protein